MLIFFAFADFDFKKFSIRNVTKICTSGGRKRERGFLQFIYGRSGQPDEMGRSVHHIDFR